MIRNVFTFYNDLEFYINWKCLMYNATFNAIQNIQITVYKEHSSWYITVSTYNKQIRIKPEYRE